MGKKTSSKHLKRVRRKHGIRKKLSGTAARPRLCVFRSARHIYAQVIDDDTAATLVSVNSLKADGYGGNRDSAAKVGKEIAEKALAAGITDVVFDRNGFLYHGRIKALADAAREGGLKF